MMSSRSPSGEPKLTAYERRLYVEVDRILYQSYLTPRTVTDFWRGDHDAIVAHLKQMKERIIRTVITVEYVEIDDVLNRAILKYIFRKERRSKRVNTLETMLDRLYPQQKLDIVRAFMSVPNPICSHVMALNTLRNTFAHRFHLAGLPRSKRF